MAQNVSIIIPTLNEESALPRLLNSLTRQSYSAKIQIIVVDGGSSDQTVELARGYRSKLDDLHIIQTSKGLPHQRNLGASKAKYHHLIFIDADSSLSKKFLHCLYSSRQASSNEPYIGMPLILPDRFDLLDYVFAAAAYTVFMATRFTAPIVTGMCIVTTRANHKSVGGFDERAVYADDIQYGIESYRRGARYHLFFRARAFSSARRGRELGRTKVGMIWVSWYRSIIKNGPITDKEAYDYKFGHFK